MNVRKKFPAIFQYLPRFTSSLASQLTVIILLISFPTLVFTLFTLHFHIIRNDCTKIVICILSSLPICYIRIYT